jgi:hypothetical protein
VSSSSERCAILAKDHTYRVVVPDDGSADPYSIESMRIQGFLYYDEIDKASHISHSEDILITTALKKDGVGQSIQKLLKLLEALHNNDRIQRIHIISCENALDSIELQELLESEVRSGYYGNVLERCKFARSVVDWICNKPLIYDGFIELVCEKYANWTVESNNTELDVFFPRTHVDIVHFKGELDPIIVRKKWLVNAVHLSIALFAHYEDELMVNDFVSHHPSGNGYLDGIIDEMRMMFQDWNISNGRPFDDNEIYSYCLQVKNRISHHPQTVSDSTTRFKKDKLFYFFADYHRKISDPALSFSKKGYVELFWIPLNLFTVTELISKQKRV